MNKSLVWMFLLGGFSFGIAFGSSCSDDVTSAPETLCTDHIKNGSESDVDCGGSCGGCATGKKCSAGSDCIDSSCQAKLCVAATCSDGIKNGGEADIDCGGSCSLCQAGKNCKGGSDCSSGVCQSSLCVAPSCSDGVKNGPETDVDCGGSCGSCGLGKSCSVASDCASNGACDADTKVCRVPISCAEILQGRPGTPDGNYQIQPSGEPSPFAAVCDMTRDGGGWTLVLKANSDATLAYTAALWTDTNLLNQTDLTTQPGNAKYQGFLSLPVIKLRGELDGYTFTTVAPMNGTAREIFAGPGGVTAPYPVPLGSGAKWSVQPNCQSFGINTPYPYQRARFGWTANQEPDCTSNDTAIGLGLGQTTAASQDRGAGYACLSTLCSQGGVNTGGNGLLWVK